MVPSPLLCRRFPSYSRGSGRACAEPQIRARAHTHLQEVRLLNFIAGNATALQKDLNGTKRDLDIGWLILCGALVFFMQVLCVCVRVRYLDALRVCAHSLAWGVHMGYASLHFQAGFAMLEAGIVQSKNMANILFKNAIDVSIAAVCYWLVGYGVCVRVRVSPTCTSTPYACMVCCDVKHTHALEHWHGTCVCVMQCSIDSACPRRAERSFMFVRRAPGPACLCACLCGCLY